MTYFTDKKACDPKWIAGDEEHDAALAESGVSVEAASRIAGGPIRWLVENIIPHDAVTVIAGEPGAGKTFFACQLAADAARVAQHRVVLATSGDESPELLRWRLDQADGDARRVALANLTPNGFKDRRGSPAEESIDERMSILYHTLLGAGDPKSGILPAEINVRDDSFPEPRAAGLLVIDDVDGWFGKPGSMLPAAALARVIQRLNELARSLHVAIVVLVRAQLSVEGRITSRQLSRLSQAASVVWMVAKDREKAEGRRQKAEEDMENPKSKIENPKSVGPPAYSQSARRWFLPVKNNLAPDAATYGRAFELCDGQIRWHGDDPAPSLAEAMLPSAHNSDRRRERRAAAAWIEEALAAGPLSSKEFYQQGLECGFSKGTLRRAATELGIHPHKTGFNGGWEMRWVPPPVVRGQGTRVRVAGSGFKIFGGNGVGHWEGESGGRGEGERETANAETLSCAPSAECEKFRAASCAPSTPSPGCAQAQEAQGQHLAERDGCPGAPRTEVGASCAPSAEREKSCETSCASSMHKASACGSATPPHPSPLPEGEGTSCASSLIVEASPETLKEAC